LKTVLMKASESGSKFRVIVADSRPKLEGREMVRHLVNAGIHCTYVHVSAVPHLIKEVGSLSSVRTPVRVTTMGEFSPIRRF
jgi:translation initiation factor eIF-2B subunit delta